ncbi:MAG TPA: hypothetical protein VII90_09905, partial [Anaerolineales bacterium]
SVRRLERFPVTGERPGSRNVALAARILILRPWSSTVCLPKFFPNLLQALDEIPKRKKNQSRNCQDKCKLVKTKIRDDLQKESEHSQTDGDPKGGMFWWGEFYHGYPFRCE